MDNMQNKSMAEWRSLGCCRCKSEKRRVASAISPGDRSMPFAYLICACGPSHGFATLAVHTGSSMSPAGPRASAHATVSTGAMQQARGKPERRPTSEGRRRGHRPGPAEHLCHMQTCSKPPTCKCRDFAPQAQCHTQRRLMCSLVLEAPVDQRPFDIVVEFLQLKCAARPPGTLRLQQASSCNKQNCELKIVSAANAPHWSQALPRRPSDAGLHESRNAPASHLAQPGPWRRRHDRQFRKCDSQVVCYP